MKFCYHSIVMILLLGLTTACNVPFEKKRLLVISDDQTGGKGWVYQLQQLRKGGPLVNNSARENTLGFNSRSSMEHNTLEQYKVYLRSGFAQMGGIDEILISVGTNDCKKENERERNNAHRNLGVLLDRISDFFEERGQPIPNIVLISPLSIADDGVVSEDYQGAQPCIMRMAEAYRQEAASRGYCLVDLHTVDTDVWLSDSQDGVHVGPRSYKKIAQQIIDACY